MANSLIAEIQTKLDRLRNLDRQFSVFGSATHKYCLNPCLSASELLQFEENYGVKLPDDYRQFLQSIGNGGPGPHYLFLPLQGDFNLSIPFPGKDILVRQQIEADWQADREILLEEHGRKIFKYLEIKEVEKISTRELFEIAEILGILQDKGVYTCYPKLLENDPIESCADIELWDVSITGFVPLFECGCGHRDILMVNGENYGMVMTFSDSDRWLSNSNLTFSQYYLTWLDEHLQDFDRCLELMNTTHSVKEIDRTMYLERMSALQSGERRFPGSSAIDLIASLIDVEKPVELFGYPGQILIRAGQTEWVAQKLEEWRNFNEFQLRF